MQATCRQSEVQPLSGKRPQNHHLPHVKAMTPTRPIFTLIVDPKPFSDLKQAWRRDRPISTQSWSAGLLNAMIPLLGTHGPCLSPHVADQDATGQLQSVLGSLMTSNAL